LQIADPDRPLLAYGHTTWHTALLGCAARPIQPRVEHEPQPWRVGHRTRWPRLALIRNRGP